MVLDDDIADCCLGDPDDLVVASWRMFRGLTSTEVATQHCHTADHREGSGAPPQALHGCADACHATLAGDVFSDLTDNSFSSFHPCAMDSPIDSGGSVYVGASSRRQAPAPTLECKRRLRWTEEMHRSFIRALKEVSRTSRVTPKRILLHMGNDGKRFGLNTSHIKSHLQKYRTSSSGCTNNADQRRVMNSSCSSGGGSKLDGIMNTSCHIMQPPQYDFYLPVARNQAAFGSSFPVRTSTPKAAGAQIRSCTGAMVEHVPCEAEDLRRRGSSSNIPRAEREVRGSWQGACDVTHLLDLEPQPTAVADSVPEQTVLGPDSLACGSHQPESSTSQPDQNPIQPYQEFNLQTRCGGTDFSNFCLTVCNPTLESPITRILSNAGSSPAKKITKIPTARTNSINSHDGSKLPKPMQLMMVALKHQEEMVKQLQDHYKVQSNLQWMLDQNGQYIMDMLQKHDVHGSHV